LFLFLAEGLWFGRKGILGILGTALFLVFWLGWFRKRKSWRDLTRRRNMLIYGNPEGPYSRNLFHRCGDLWNYFMK
jgi:hypothetical protein